MSEPSKPTTKQNGPEGPLAREFPPGGEACHGPAEAGSRSKTVLLERGDGLDHRHDLLVSHSRCIRSVNSLGEVLAWGHLCLLDRRNRDKHMLPHLAAGVKA